MTLHILFLKVLYDCYHVYTVKPVEFKHFYDRSKFRTGIPLLGVDGTMKRVF